MEGFRNDLVYFHLLGACHVFIWTSNVLYMDCMHLLHSVFMSLQLSLQDWNYCASVILLPPNQQRLEWIDRSDPACYSLVDILKSGFHTSLFIQYKFALYIVHIFGLCTYLETLATAVCWSSRTCSRHDTMKVRKISFTIKDYFLRYNLTIQTKIEIVNVHTSTCARDLQSYLYEPENGKKLSFFLIAMIKKKRFFYSVYN